MKNRCVLIRPFFKGHFLNYFQLFLNSCGNNPEFDWMVFTDNEDKYDFPKNVHKIKMTFEEAKELFQSRFDFPLSIANPYKLCDYKSSFGYVFADYIRDYDFWGHTDYDIIYGDLKKFVTDDMLEKYDKLFVLGHFALYRNTEDISELFMKPLNGRLLYKEAMTSELNCNFDEDWNGIPNVNDIFRAYGKRLYENTNNSSMIADIHDKSTNFKVVYQRNTDWKNIIEKKQDGFFAYVDGKLLRYLWINGQMETKEYMYIHLKHRKMEIKSGIFESTNFTIIPDAFEPLNFEVDDRTFANVRQKTWNLNYFRLRWNNLKVKTGRFISGKNNKYQKVVK